MTRLRHIFRHLSAAAKKSYLQQEWKLLRTAVSAEDTAAMEDLRQRIALLEKRLKQVKRQHEESERTLGIEARIIALKQILISKSGFQH